MLLYFSDLWSLGLVNKPHFPHILPKLTEHQSTEIQRSQCTLPVNPAFAKSVYKGKGYLFQNQLIITKYPTQLRLLPGFTILLYQTMASSLVIFQMTESLPTSYKVSFSLSNPF